MLAVAGLATAGLMWWLSQSRAANQALLEEQSAFLVEENPALKAEGSQAISLWPSLVSGVGSIQQIGQLAEQKERGLAGVTLRAPFDGADFMTNPNSALRMAAARKIVISGRVVGGAATVYVLGEGGKRVAQSNTDNYGRFLIEVADGDYKLVSEGENLASRLVPLSKREDGSVVPAWLLLEPAFSVRGQVVDQVGRGISAQVMVRPLGGRKREVVADKSGYFVASGLVVGLARISARARGYLAQESVQFLPGRGYKPHLRLIRGASIVVSVKDTTGALVAGADVSLARISEVLAKSSVPMAPLDVAGGSGFIVRGELGVVVGPIPFPPSRRQRIRMASSLRGVAPGLEKAPTTTLAGEHTFYGLDAGHYRVRAGHPDFVESPALSVFVQLGKTGSAKFLLSRGSAIMGRISADQELVAFAEVRAITNSGRSITVFANAQGHYRLPRMTGPIKIKASASGFAMVSRDLTLTPADAAELIVDIELAPARATLRGRVYSPRGFPVAGAKITVKTKDDPRTKTTDRHGRFAVLGLSEGKHWVQCRAGDYPPISLALATGAEHRLNLQYGGSVVLTVRRQRSGLPVVGVRIELVAKSGEAHQLLTDAEGVARATALVPGPFIAKVNVPGFAPQSVQLRVARSHAKNAAPSRATLLLQRGATVAGEVRDRDGQRVRGAVVRLDGVTDTTDELGHFELRDVASGLIWLEASKGRMIGRVSLHLVPGELITTARIDLRNTATAALAQSPSVVDQNKASKAGDAEENLDLEEESKKSSMPVSAERSPSN